ncbi:MAG: glycine cleavage system aminomethyltransferase GcvT, partial [Candidatus Hodarchaeales archaeon]
MIQLKKTPLYTWHITRANMVPFAGFNMPVVYKSPSSITGEHLAVRNNAGIFDVSHMGRMFIKGTDAVKFLDIIIPRNLATLPIGKVAYCYFLNERAGFRDDLTVARTNEKEYLITW